MKKREILALIEANRTINKNDSILSITRDDRFSSLIDRKYWFPDIEELKDEFNILGEEVQEALDETNNCKEYIKNSGCSHEIRLQHYGFIVSHSNCVLCGRSYISDNCRNWEYSINRNKYCVNLIAKYQDDEDCDYVPDGYTNEEVYEIIINILKDKEDDEEIDLVQEFKKLNLPNSEVNEEKRVIENYILIIGGSNKQFIDSESYLYKNGLKIGLEFVKYFSALLNTKVELIDNSEILESKDLNKYFPKENYKLKFTSYKTIDDLEKELLKQKEIPFKIIIDLSELYEYKISGDVITKEVYSLKLSEIFSNSHIIRINNLSKKGLEELSEYLKCIGACDNIYAYQKDKYYYLENDEIKSDNLENTCSKIKKLLKKS